MRELLINKNNARDVVQSCWDVPYTPLFNQLYYDQRQRDWDFGAKHARLGDVEIQRVNDQHAPLGPTVRRPTVVEGGDPSRLHMAVYKVPPPSTPGLVLALLRCLPHHVSLLAKFWSLSLPLL
jgi:hypothetical protein